MDLNLSFIFYLVSIQILPKLVEKQNYPVNRIINTGRGINLLGRSTHTVPISRLDGRKVGEGELSERPEFSFNPVEFLINLNLQNKKIILIYHKGSDFYIDYFYIQ